MKRWTVGVTAVVLVAPAIAGLAVAPIRPAAPPAYACASVGAPVRVGDPYRGVALNFHEEPAVMLVPSTKVYYVRDRECDLYRFGRFWYYLEDGLWYRARAWQGPFIHLHSSSVPRSVRTVPLNYRRHW